MDLKKPLSTSDVPSQFLASVYLVGHIPFQALKTDPRISYSLYVPADRYDDCVTAGLPLVVSIHGTRRDPSMLYDDATAAFANAAPCAILVPLFPAGLDGPNDLDSYKELRSQSVQSDIAMLSILDEVAQRWPGIRTRKVFLIGFSGGGQFAHRMLYLYPERFAAVSVGAPGSVTELDPNKLWPRGISNVQDKFGKEVNVAGIRNVPIQLVVGDQDTQPHDGEDFWACVNARRGHKAIPAGQIEYSDMQRNGRLGAIRRLQQTWREHGIESQLHIVPGVGHSSRKVRAHVFDFLQPLLQKASR